MRTLLLPILALAMFCGCTKIQSEGQSPRNHKELVFIQKCENQNNQRACEILLERAQSMCDNYHTFGCAVLYYIHSPGKINFYIKDISQKELRKNAVFYLTKACMLGDDLMCRILERWKINLKRISIKNEPLFPYPIGFAKLF